VKQNAQTLRKMLAWPGCADIVTFGTETGFFFWQLFNNVGTI